MAWSTSARAADTFTPLFNGRDLSGWVLVNVASNTFTVRDGVIVSTGKPTGVMRTDRHYENFILEAEWKHLQPKGNAGIFIWSEPMTAPGTPFAKSIEVQVLDPAADHPEGIATGHGDLFAIHGARLTPDRPHPRGWERCLPAEKRAKPASAWNHYRIEAIAGRLTLAVNGKIVSGGTNCTPRKGYICLESEGSECHFRNLRLQELPSSNPAPEQIASKAESWQSLYTGLDLSGWKVERGRAEQWQVKDWVLECDGRESTVISSVSGWQAPCILQFDWRRLDHDTQIECRFFGLDSPLTVNLRTGTKALGPNGWNRTWLWIEVGPPGRFGVRHNDQAGEPAELRKIISGPTAGPMCFAVSNGRAQLANFFVQGKPWMLPGAK